MKKNLLLSTLSIFSIVVYSQNPTIQWKKNYGGSSNDFSRSISQTSDGGYIVAGAIQSNDGDVTGYHASFDYWIVKLDNTGTIQWQKALGGTGYDHASSIKQTKDGGYIVAGWSDSNDGDVTGNHGETDYWIVKLDNTGTIQWQKSYGGSASDFANSVFQNSDSTYIIGGRTYSNNGDVTGNHGTHDYWIVKLDVAGNLVWQKTLGGSGIDYGYTIRQTNYDGGIIITGNTNSNNGDVTGNHGLDDAWVVKLDGNGTIQWQKTYGGSGNDYLNNVYQTGDGGFIFIGNTESNDGDVSGNHGQSDCWVVKVNATGVIQWQKTLGGTTIDIGNAIQQTSDNGYILAGWSDSNNGDLTLNQGGGDYWLVKLDNTGAITWQQSFGGTSADFSYAIDVTSDGGFVVAGNTASSDGDVIANNGSHDYWIIKFNGLALANNNSLASSDKIIAYPNPTTGAFRLDNLSINSIVEIFDITGRTILKLDSQNSSAFIDLSERENGIYFYRITSDDITAGKIIKH